eukprot:TRINITY_DN6970_c0_g1_i1.p1 TRINITY_DN6970_c0_g1~~TRINITY_DN6970_c0_g1_i1.p1  ORF type:complete len:318 (-),score=36.09 TRINITY_DN6970_c0_g1_i1:7-960(-)
MMRRTVITFALQKSRKCLNQAQEEVFKRRKDMLIEPAELWEQLQAPDSPRKLRLVDCSTLHAYRRAHINGAVQLPWDTYLKDKDEQLSVLPTTQFEKLALQLGLGNQAPDVVLYDDANSLLAARAWWVLRYYGYPAGVRVLNGGWHRWIVEGRPVTFHAFRPPRVSQAVPPAPQPERIASIETVIQLARDPESGAIWDTRSVAEWNGTESRGNRRVGHVPNAKHLEWSSVVTTDDNRTFLHNDDLKQTLTNAGLPVANDPRPCVTYCQAGIRAAHAAFTFELVTGRPAQVYDRSMAEYANTADAPPLVTGNKEFTWQ